MGNYWIAENNEKIFLVVLIVLSGAIIFFVRDYHGFGSDATSVAKMCISALPAKLAVMNNIRIENGALIYGTNKSYADDFSNSSYQINVDMTGTISVTRKDADLTVLMRPSARGNRLHWQCYMPFPANSER